MKFFTSIVLFAVAVSAAALPTPMSEADIDKLRSQGVSESDIASRFPGHGHRNASLIRRIIDTDGEVAPGHFASSVAARGTVEAHAGLDASTAEGHAVSKHVHLVKTFIHDVLSGKLAVAGNGGVAMRRKRAMEKEEAAGVEQRPARWIYHW